MKRSPLTAASHVIRAALVTGLTATAGWAAADGELGGNRYLYERYYAADMSVAHAFVESVVKQGRWSARSDKLVIVDVRDASEYKAGHPEGAFHVPYPRIYQECKTNPNNASDPITRTEDGGSCLYGAVSGSRVNMTDEQLFLAIEALFPDKSQRLALLCRTGSRSVRAGNILAKPENYLGPAYAGRGYDRVYNLWQGFVGQPLAPIHVSTGRVIGPADDVVDVTLDGGATAKGFAAYALDLDKDGVITANDLDGWRYHQGLPFDTRMLPQKLSQDAYPYYAMP